MYAEFQVKITFSFKLPSVFLRGTVMSYGISITLGIQNLTMPLRNNVAPISVIQS